jgi:hypothetical protein
MKKEKRPCSASKAAAHCIRIIAGKCGTQWVYCIEHKTTIGLLHIMKSLLDSVNCNARIVNNLSRVLSELFSCKPSSF